MTHFIRYRITATGVEREGSFDNALARALFLIGWSGRIDVLKEWTA